VGGVAGTGAPVTLADVARRAGVSLSTASRVINGSDRQVTPELEQRVLAAAADLAYTPNAQAQALARSASNVVGLIIGDITDPYFSSIANGVIRVADSRGLLVMLGTTFRDPQREIDFAKSLRAQRVRAIILVGTRPSSHAMNARLAAVLRDFQDAGGRVSCVSQARLPVDTIVPENRASAHKLARELLALGHREFAILAPPRSLLTSQERAAGFRDGLTAAGIELADSAIFEGSLTRDGGYAAARELIVRKPAVTCVFAISDVMAIGAMAAFRESGVALPGDLSVAGFGDIASLRDLTPSLTTVRLPLEDMGARAAELVLTPADTAPRVIRIPGEVVIRESTRPLGQRSPGSSCRA
jgi:LacI family transcriptional regulator